MLTESRILFRSELLKLLSKVLALEGDVGLLGQCRADLEARLLTAEESQRVLQAQLAGVRSELCCSKAELEREQESREGVRERLEAREQMCRDLEAGVESARAEARAWREEAETKGRAAESLEQQVRGLSEDLRRAQQGLEESVPRSELAAVKSRLEAAREEARESGLRLESWRIEASGWATQVKLFAKMQVQCLLGRLEALEADVTSAEESRRQLRTQLAEAIDASKKLKDQMVACRRDLAAASYEKQILQDSLQSIESEMQTDYKVHQSFIKTVQVRSLSENVSFLIIEVALFSHS